MSSIVHISDLHFGMLREEALEPLLAEIGSLAPSVVVISGDLTQRARRAQFRAAAAFIERLPVAQRVIVPGNHDIPLFNPLARFLHPRRLFREYIHAESYPCYVDDDLAIIGIDTTRATAAVNGRVNRAQLQQVSDFFKAHPRSLCRIVVAHHPFVLPEDTENAQLVGRAEKALSSLLEEEVDLLLTGHRHVSWTRQFDAGLLTVHCGTSTSSRTRGEANAFHEIVVSTGEVEVRPWHWQGDQGRFQRDEADNWTRLPRKSAVETPVTTQDETP